MGIFLLKTLNILSRPEELLIKNPISFITLAIEVKVELEYFKGKRIFNYDVSFSLQIICIAAAGWHSAAISAFGDIYTWGFNSNGQLGIKMYKNCTIKEPAIYVVPQVVDIMDLTCCDNKEQDCFPTKIAAGARHTMVEMNCGAVYAAGWNAYGQLGLPNKELYTDQFQYVLKFKNCKDNVEIVSGSWNTLIGMRESSKREINENI